MSHRFARAVSALLLCASATTAITLTQAEIASAATFSVSIATGGSIGNMGVDAVYNGSGGGGAYDSYSRWDSNGNLTLMTMQNGYYQDAAGSPLSVAGTPTMLRVELYPKPTSNINIPYDVWSGNVGGAAAQRDQATDGVNWKNFGTISLPTIGQGDAFRIEGAIVSSTPVPDGRVEFDLFQIQCGYPDTCIDTKYSSTGAPVGTFATGASRNGRWSGGVGWPGHYIVFIRDKTTGRQVHGFMEIDNGSVPAIDLDVACFGMQTCAYDAGSVGTPSGGFHPVTPTRILDTRFGLGIDTGAVRPGDGRLSDPNPVKRRTETRNHELKVTGVAGVPTSGVSAVLLNLTAVAPPTAGYVSVSPRPSASGDVFNDQATYGAPPGTSNLNLTAGETVPNMVLARVGAGGTIRFTYAGFGDMNIIADVAGWFDTGAAGSAAGGLGFTGLAAPARLMDTRNGIGDTIGRFQPGDDRVLKVAGIAGVPADAKSVVLNITSGAPRGIGFVTAYPTGQAMPVASNLNVNPGQTRANLSVVKVGPDGNIRLAVFETDTDLVVDVFGYYGSGGGKTTTIEPVRVVDSRSGLGTPRRPMNAQESRNVQVAGVGGVPANATGVLLNVTAVNTDSWGWLTVWPTGQRQPPSSNLNWEGGRIVPNMVVVAVGANGSISLYNDLGHTDILVDIFGYVT